jgi:3-methyladenine DNA glycosylase AlkD
MTVPEIMAELQAKGSESIKNVLVKHGVKEPFFGVKIEYLKPIQKKIKADYQLAKDLYATGNADAMYLAGLIADDEQMTPGDLDNWAEKALSQNISEYTVPWVAAQGKHGFEMAMKWIDSPQEHIAAAGWSTLNNFIALTPDDELDLPALKKLMARVKDHIHGAQNRVKYTMNGFVVGVACYVTPLKNEALAIANSIKDVTVDMNGTSCKLPRAADYVSKLEARGALGKKKKMVKC